MKGNQPKRRKDKDNPYHIYESEGQYFITFRDGEGIVHNLEVNKILYDVFNSFELEDLRYLNVLDRHIEHSETRDSTLYKRAIHKPESIEEVTVNKVLTEQLRQLINHLPPVQRRRLIMYFFEDMTYDQIAEKEGCTKMPVKRSIDAAIENIRKKLFF